MTGGPSAPAPSKIVMLGTGTPVANPHRSGPAQAIVANGEPYLFDFGPGVVRRAAALSPRFGGDIPEMDPGRLTTAFLTHLHSDHTAGLPDLLLSGWTSGQRDRPLRVFGPDGTDELIDGVLQAYDRDIKNRVYGTEPTNDQGWRVEFAPIHEGEVYRDDNLAVTAFPVIHGTWPNAFGFRVETADKTIVLSGDLRPCGTIETYGGGADYLIHEVYSSSGFRNANHLEQSRRDYVRSTHTSTEELVELACKLRPKTLVLTHVLWYGVSVEDLLAEVTEGYDGHVIVAEDLDVYD